MPYANEYKNVPIHFVGSIAYHTRKIINEELEKFGLIANSFVRRPVENLIDNMLQLENTIIEKSK